MHGQEHSGPLFGLKVYVVSAFLHDEKFSLVQHKVLRGCRPAGRGGFSVHTKTVLWRWRMSANVPEDCFR